MNKNTQISALQFFKCLSDDTRLRCLLLITAKQELCVCDLVCALALEQPKISRHLAILKECGIVAGRREGQWIHYALDPDLPAWARDILFDTLNAHRDWITENLANIHPPTTTPSQSCC